MAKGETKRSLNGDHVIRSRISGRNVNCRYAAVAALAGWYLLTPPVANHGQQSDPSAPLTDWQKVGTYDHAMDCESARLKMMQDICKGHPDSCEVLPYNLYCVKTDDPRLEGKGK